DYDLLTTDRRILEAGFWSELERDGIAVDRRKGDWDDPIAGPARIKEGHIYVDVILARGKWEQAVIERAEPIDLGGFSLPVPLTSDLILLKLAAGGLVDLQDVAVLLERGDRASLVASVDEK